MPRILQILTLIIILATTVRAGNFPISAWDASYLRNIPQATALMERESKHFRVEPPPSDDSEVTRAEIQHLRQLADNRTSEDIILITKEHLDPYKRFFEVLEIEQQDYPQLEKLIRYIASESYLPVLHFKHKFSRTRPYQIDRTLVTVIDGPPHASYPSGHATQAYLIALILSDMFPSNDPHIARLLELGKGIGIRREIAGVHYPSDTKAGIDLAMQLKAWITRKPDFQQAFSSAKEELKSLYKK